MNPAAVDTFVYLWAACGFALLAYLQCFFIRKAFQKFGSEALSQKTVQSDGAVFIDEEHRDRDVMVQESSYSDPNWNRREDIVGPDKPQKKRRR